MFNAAHFQHRAYALAPPTPAHAEALGAGLALIDPWQQLGYSAAALSRYLAAHHAERQSLVVLAEQQPAACLTIRHNWLRGPLLELLAVLPPYQGQGLGQALIGWLLAEARAHKQGNVWTLTSAFNHSARAFYQRQGFTEVGDIPGLINADTSERLLRVRL